MNIYLIPGLGADKRMYVSQLRVLPNATVLEHLPHVVGETLPQYARRMAAGIDTSQPFVLIGTSLGGIVSMEISRFLQPQKVILLATVKHRGELPLFVRSMKYLKLHRLITGKGYKRFNKYFVQRLVNARHTETAKQIHAMMLDASNGFIEWGIDAVINWEGAKDYRADVIHIHGTRDHLFPVKNITNAITVKGGSHVMNMSMSADVNRLLLKALEQ